MKLKSLLFGSAAIIAAGTGAQAADLPTVEPVEYVRICDAFGTGFYYIPGTDTCLQVSGQVRIESRYTDGDISDRFGIPEEEYNHYTTRARGNIRLDARTQTDFGLVRAFIDFQMQVGNGDGDSLPDPGGANYSAAGVDLSAAFIQVSNNWGTYTAGHTGSNFDFWGSYGFGSGVNIDDQTTEQTQFAWTFAGGNGFSFTVAAEDPASSGRRLDNKFTYDDYEGQDFPDGVANIRVDQGWGSAAVMGAVRHIHDFDGNGIGFAVGAGLRLAVPGGWEFNSEGGFADGALGYITNDPGGAGDFGGAPPFPTGDDTNQAWMVRAGVTGPIFTNVTVWADGSFTHADNDGAPGAFHVNYDFWGFKVGGQWQPVPGLTMGPEFAFNRIDYSAGGLDSDLWNVIWRVQRKF